MLRCFVLHSAQGYTLSQVLIAIPQAQAKVRRKCVDEMKCWDRNLEKCGNVGKCGDRRDVFRFANPRSSLGRLGERPVCPRVSLSTTRRGSCRLRKPRKFKMGDRFRNNLDKSYPVNRITGGVRFRFYEELTSSRANPPGALLLTIRMRRVCSTWMPVGRKKPDVRWFSNETREWIRQVAAIARVLESF
jgi:hypothetical protein